jgi:hypothetical protein
MGFEPWAGHIRMAQAFRNEIDHHQMETGVELDTKKRQLPFATTPEGGT